MADQEVQASTSTSPAPASVSLTKADLDSMLAKAAADGAAQALASVKATQPSAFFTLPAQFATAAAPKAPAGPSCRAVAEILFKHGQRATYSAVAKVCGVFPPIRVGGLLGERDAVASMVVKKGTGAPSLYTAAQVDPRFLQAGSEVLKNPVIDDGGVLAEWLAKHAS